MKLIIIEYIDIIKNNINLMNINFPLNENRVLILIIEF